MSVIWIDSARFAVAASGIVTSGLVMYLDAANTSSYSGSGTNWLDLTGNANNVSMQNSSSISWNSSGFFSTGATGWFSGAGTATLPTGNSAYTLLAWVRVTGSWNRKGIVSLGGYGVANASNVLRTGSGSIGHLAHYWWASDLNANNNSASLATNKWFMVAATYNQTTRRIWANTTNVASDSQSSRNGGQAIQIAKTYDGDAGNPTEYLANDIALAMIYNRALSSTEIADNYNFFASRFGL
jgi:hypothetical protein